MLIEKGPYGLIKLYCFSFMWAIFMPMLIVSAGLLVRYAFSKFSGQPTTVKDIAAVSVKAVPWAFFVASIRFCTLSLITNANLVTKIYFPRELFPISATLSQFFDIMTAVVQENFNKCFRTEDNF